MTGVDLVIVVAASFVAGLLVGGSQRRRTDGGSGSLEALGRIVDAKREQEKER